MRVDVQVDVLRVPFIKLQAAMRVHEGQASAERSSNSPVSNSFPVSIFGTLKGLGPDLRSQYAVQPVAFIRSHAAMRVHEGQVRT